MLVNGSLESLSSSTTSVLESKAGSILENRIICPGYHDGGGGRRGNGICVAMSASRNHRHSKAFRIFTSSSVLLEDTESNKACKLFAGTTRSLRCSQKILQSCNETERKTRVDTCYVSSCWRPSAMAEFSLTCETYITVTRRSGGALR
jgi:hypothetical protein